MQQLRIVYFVNMQLYDPLRGVPVVELEVIKEGKLRHG